MNTPNTNVWISLLFVLLPYAIVAQQAKVEEKAALHTINGTVRDKNSFELLPGASIWIKDTQLGATTNHYGFFSISVKSKKTHTIQISFVGYQTETVEITLERDTLLSIELTEKNTLLGNVEITGHQDSEGLLPAGEYRLLSKDIKNIPAFAGESDALKSLQFLPGVQTSNEGTTNLSVRGGSFDQNLYLLDEAPVYNPAHALSFFSVFNPDALQQVNFYKGPIPVRYGGRLSSIVNVRMKEGNKNKQVVSGTIGTIASRAIIEGPFKKDNRFSYLISGRYSYVGPVVNGVRYLGQIFNDVSVQNNIAKINFYDFNAKVNFRKNEKNHFYTSFYSGRDKFFLASITNGYQLEWGNTTSTFRWNHIYNSKLFSNTTVLFSNYKYAYDILDDTRYFRWKAKLTEATIKQDYDYYPSSSSHITFGFSSNLHLIQPGSITSRNTVAVITPYSLDHQQALENGLYAGNEQQLSSKLKAGYGVRYSSFVVFGPGKVYQFSDNDDKPIDSIIYKSFSVMKVYHRLEPRGWLTWQTSSNSNFTISYDRNNQFMHLLTNSSLGMPTDVWAPSSNQIRPQTSDIYSASYQIHLNEPGLDIQGGTFYKRLQNVIDLKDNANLMVNRYVASQVLQGSGRSHGYELYVKKKKNIWEGSLSYTWSKTMFTIPGINQGNPYPARYDKRHVFYLTNTLQVNRQWQVSSNFVFSTGGAITLPKGGFYFEGASFNYYTSRNGYRLPNYNRLDISFNYNPRKNDSRKWKGYWSFDIYNVYGKKNPFTLYAKPKDYDFGTMQLSAIYLYRVVPTVSYRFTI
jgi:hypothetical protein